MSKKITDFDESDNEPSVRRSEKKHYKNRNLFKVVDNDGGGLPIRRGIVGWLGRFLYPSSSISDDINRQRIFLGADKKTTLITIASFESNGRTIKLRKPLLVEVKHEKGGDIAENADYSICVYAEKGEDITEAIRTDLSVSWSRLTRKRDSELTQEAIDLKNRMLANMYEE